MPEEILLPENDSSISNNKIEINCRGLIMEIDLNSGELLRVISSNPGDYLIYQPGLKIDFVPQVH